eukprot:164004-Rhodomonas_salina.3
MCCTGRAYAGAVCIRARNGLRSTELAHSGAICLRAYYAMRGTVTSSIAILPRASRGSTELALGNDAREAAGYGGQARTRAKGPTCSVGSQCSTDARAEGPTRA